MNVEERFARYVVCDLATRCWIWVGARQHTKYGLRYGYFTIGKLMNAHRASWILFRGPIPNGLFVLHECDNTGCVRPSHLFLGTHKRNMYDMRMKERLARRDKGLSRKLTLAQVAAISARYAAGDISQRALAKQFGIAQATVWTILHS